MTISLNPPFGSLSNATEPGRHVSASRRAVVIGAGMGGLVAARVLANHFQEVIVIERDRLPPIGENRKGVPQGQHVHGLLAQGCATLESLFPGLLDNFAEHGANVDDAMGAIRWHQSGGYHAPGLLGLRAVSASRPLLEGVVRDRLLQIPGIEIRQDTSVESLVWDTPGERVSGVRLSGTGASGDGVLMAALVVDAAGRGSRLPAWLHDAGLDRPMETSVGIGIRYASRIFRREQGHMGGKHITVIVSNPKVPRGGLVCGIEGDRWLVTLAGRRGIQPPVDIDGFLDFTKSFEAPDIHDLVRQAEPLDEGATYGFPRSLRRHYDALDRFPAGIIPIADAICGFNPIYGQGMTVVALEAQELDRCLADGTEDLAARYFASISPLVDGAWKLATSGDMRFLVPADALPRKVRAITWYMDRLHVAARHDPEVAMAFSKVVHLLEPPASLLTPEMAARVAKGNIRLGMQRRSTPQALNPAHPAPTPAR
jgi:2-polyprenyl-6-methoxyphenol hydroxylase-like FAD-dependent oxidoreductase